MIQAKLFFFIIPFYIHQPVVPALFVIERKNKVRQAFCTDAGGVMMHIRNLLLFRYHLLL
jgi:hypothetical protein